MPVIFQFLHTAITDQDRTEVTMKASIGLLGDIAEAFSDGRMKQPLSGEWISEGLKIARTRFAGSSELKKVTKWSKEVSTKKIPFCFF
jgi:importin subunit beta-1